MIFMILMILIIFYFIDYKIHYKFSCEQPNDLKIPKVIIQTYNNKSKIRNKVYTNIQKYASEYTHIIYDDKECIEFLHQFDVTFASIKTFNSNIVDKFKSFKKGAHKADLFRYCYLYQYGGIYIDIKTELSKPLKNIFTEDNTLYTVLSILPNTIYQGIIAVYPKNPMIACLINDCMNSNRLKLFVNYQIFTQFFYKKIAEDVRQITIGNQNTDSGNNIHLFQEKKYPKSECDNNLDRYNTCSFIIDEYGNKMFKTRYFDYPWV